MVYPYLVTVRNKFRNAIDRFSLLVTVTSALLFMLAYFTSESDTHYLLIGALIILAAAGWGAFRLFKRKERVRFNYVLLMTGMVWGGMPFYPWLSIPLIIMALIEHQAKKDLEIGFADDVIVFNTIPRKTYYWKDLSNVVLKDNLLTLDFNNNRLFQRETIDDDEEDDCEEEEFNQYCRERLLHR